MVMKSKKTYEQKTFEAIKILENASGLTKSETTELMLEKVKRIQSYYWLQYLEKKYKIKLNKIQNKK